MQQYPDVPLWGRVGGGGSPTVEGGSFKDRVLVAGVGVGVEGGRVVEGWGYGGGRKGGRGDVGGGQGRGMGMRGWEEGRGIGGMRGMAEERE